MNARTLLFVATLLAALGTHGRAARAELSGAVDARPLFGMDGRYGGGFMGELWATRGIARPGVSFGLSALSKSDDASSRFVTPLAASLCLVPSRDASGFTAVARLGGYIGAEKGGFIGGGYASGALGYAIGLGEGATVRLTADVWALIGQRGGVFFGPAVGFGF